MIIKSLKIVLFIMAIIFSQNLWSQEFNLFLEQLKEDRNYDKSSIIYHPDSVSTITLTTMVNGITLDKNHLIKLKDIQATDNKSNSMTLLSSNFYYDDRYQWDKKLEIKLEAPIRNATEINVRGSLLYFTPSQKNKAKVIIRNVLNRPGENLLKNSYPNSELIYIKTHELLNLKAELENQINSETEKRKKEVGEISHEELNEIEYTRQLFNDMFDLSNNRNKHTITFRSKENIKDTYISFIIFNTKDEPIRSGYLSINNIYQYHLTEPMTQGCYIQIIKEVESAIKELQFELKNIILD